jgi:4-hydroxy-tetrahydrodipicolinate synthase
MIRALCEVETVKGVKWAAPNPVKLSEAKAACDPSLTWVGGLAEVWAPAFYGAGARGFTSGLINIWPAQSVAIHAALEAGEFAQAHALIAAMKPFEDIRAQELNGTNVTTVKAALQAMGQDCGPTRAPSAWPLTPEQHATMMTFLQAQTLV